MLDEMAEPVSKYIRLNPPRRVTSIIEHGGAPFINSSFIFFRRKIISDLIQYPAGLLHVKTL